MTRILGLILVAALARAAWAGEAAPAAADPVLEERVLTLASELRCLVCQNQTIADSQAPLAIDLRDQIREKMRQGQSERDIVNYMVARYGEFVLYRPTFRPATILLWIGPALLLLAGMAALVRRISRRRAEARPELTAEEQARAAALLGTEQDGERR